MAKTKKLSVSVGVFAYNEDRNIAKTLDSILKQKLDQVQIKQILVVSSGSFDRTNDIIRKYAKKDSRIKLISQLTREGKSSAINEFLAKAKNQLVVVISGDLRLHTRAIEEITLPFLHEDVGMVGCHPIPVNTQSNHNPVGPQVRLLWHLHHLVSLKNAKCGEMVAFRNLLRSIPKQSAVDEATIEVLLHLIGYKIAYAPRSIVYNRGPNSISDFIKQRRRVYVGHQWVMNNYNYKVSTINTGSTSQVIREYLLAKPQDTYNILKLLTLEGISRILGWIDFNILNKNPYIWELVKR